jgi:CheY-like chemotaxis protein
VETLLSSHGARITKVSNGKEAVQAATHRDFDVILMDLQMPELDGYDATKQLRDNEYSKPIIALSASAMREEYSRALDAGCNAHLTKPFKHKELIETIQHYSGPKRKQSHVTNPLTFNPS